MGFPSSRQQQDQRGAARSRRKRKIPTPTYLANVALHYLGRFAASEAGLRRVLENRLRRAGMDHPAFAADGAAQENLRQVIDTIVEQHKKTGAINDAAFAAMKVNSLRRAGGSARRITQKLQVKGVAQNVITTALRPEDDGNERDVELRAAQVLAKKRGLGSWRKKAAAENQQQKDFATLMRAGFSYDIAKQVLGNNEEITDPDF